MKKVNNILWRHPFHMENEGYHTHTHIFLIKLWKFRLFHTTTQSDRHEKSNRNEFVIIFLASRLLFTFTSCWAPLVWLKCGKRYIAILYIPNSTSIICTHSHTHTKFSSHIWLWHIHTHTSNTCEWVRENGIEYTKRMWDIVSASTHFLCDVSIYYFQTKRGKKFFLSYCWCWCFLFYSHISAEIA